MPYYDSSMAYYISVLTPRVTIFSYQRVIHMKDLSLGKSVQTGLFFSRLGILIVFQAYYVQT